METKVKIILMSHLSDISIESGFDNRNDHELRSRMKLRAEFCKWLIIQFPDTNTEIDADVAYSNFLTLRKSR